MCVVYVVCMSITVEGEYKEGVLLIYFTDNCCRRREKIMEGKDRNFIMKERNGKKDENSCV